MDAEIMVDAALEKAVENDPLISNLISLQGKKLGTDYVIGYRNKDYKVILMPVDKETLEYVQKFLAKHKDNAEHYFIAMGDTERVTYHTLEGVFHHTDRSGYILPRYIDFDPRRGDISGAMGTSSTTAVFEDTMKYLRRPKYLIIFKYRNNV